MDRVDPGSTEAGPAGSPALPGPPMDVVEAARAEVAAGAGAGGKPEWVDRFVWTALWKVVTVALATAGLLFVLYQARHFVGLLVVATFFALAMIPGVNHMQSRWGWRRGAAVGLIYGAGVVLVVAMVAVLIPGIVQFADRVGQDAGGWISQLNEVSVDLFGSTLVDPAAGESAASAVQSALSQWAGNILGFVSSGVGVVFDLFTIASFTFYIAADYPRIERALMSRMPPARQRVFGWISDTSIDQTGGYFYSRLLLLLINGGLSMVVMLLIGLPLVLALPMAVFMGFAAEFIPVIGTYLGAAIPIALTLAVQGLGSAVVLLVWVIVYQQVENLFLSPKLSAHTMELNGAIAFGSALAGGAIAGAMGAFMALPVAALITALIKNSGTTYDIVYRAKYDTTIPPADPS